MSIINIEIILIILDIIAGDMRQRCPQFSNLLQMWFPPGAELPRAYLMDTSEEALLIQVNISTEIGQ